MRPRGAAVAPVPRPRAGVHTGCAARVLSRRACLVSALLAGCTTLAPPAPGLSGRLAVRVDAMADRPARTFSADFDLRGDAERGSLRLSGPLGAVLAEVRWQPGRAELQDAQATRDYPALDALTQDLFGESLPLAALLDWLRGRPWSGAPNTPLPGGFEQLGWRVAAADGVLQASRERAPAISVRARLEAPA